MNNAISGLENSENGGAAGADGKHANAIQIPTASSNEKLNTNSLLTIEEPACGDITIIHSRSPTELLEGFSPGTSNIFMQKGTLKLRNSPDLSVEMTDASPGQRSMHKAQSRILKAKVKHTKKRDNYEFDKNEIIRNFKNIERAARERVKELEKIGARGLRAQD